MCRVFKNYFRASGELEPQIEGLIWHALEREMRRRFADVAGERRWGYFLYLVESLCVCSGAREEVRPMDQKEIA